MMGGPRALPPPLEHVQVPKFLSPSRFGALRRCRLSVLATAEPDVDLPPEPAALLGTLLHHVIAEVGAGRWSGAGSAREAFAGLLEHFQSEESWVEASAFFPEGVERAVGRNEWLRRVASARKWALADAPQADVGRDPRPLRLGNGRPLAEPDHETSDPEPGREVSIVWPDGRLRGRADRLDRNADGWVVTDDKTGYVDLAEDGEGDGDSSLQLELYALALESLTEKAVVLRIRSAGGSGDDGDFTQLPWDDRRRAEIRTCLKQELKALPAETKQQASYLASPGSHCRLCRIRPRCATYLAEAPRLWASQETAGRMPLDTWGEIHEIELRDDGHWLSICDDEKRLVRVGAVDPERGVGELAVGDVVHFFGLIPDQSNQNAERVQFTNLRELPSPGSSYRRRAHGLRVFRGPAPAASQ